MKPFAVFAVCKIGNLYCATTRDGADKGKIGLPGGKVDPDEDPVSALLREAKEEGFLLSDIDPNPCSIQVIDGNLVHWHKAKSAVQLTDYKEKNRGIQNILVNKKQILTSGFGNDNLDL